jgi:hypothetical protein
MHGPTIHPGRDVQPMERIAVGSFGPKSERKAPLTSAIHKPVVRLGKKPLVSAFASVEVQRRGDAGRRFGEFELDLTNDLLWTIARTEANVPHGQRTREFYFPIHIQLGNAAAELILPSVARRAMDLHRLGASRHCKNAQCQEEADELHEKPPLGIRRESTQPAFKSPLGLANIGAKRKRCDPTEFYTTTTQVRHRRAGGENLKRK